jgi:broad specificity phosphatase PhoE
MTTFLLIRHGHTDAVGRFLAGRLPGIELSPAGRAEAQRMAADLPPIDVVYSSPLRRCLQTAEAIAGRFRLPIRPHMGLQEIDFGEWTGLSFDALNDRPDWRRFNEHRAAATIPGGESIAAVLRRVLATLEDIAARHAGQTVAAVSHGDVIKSALLHYRNAPLDLMPVLDIPTASPSALVWHAPDHVIVPPLPWLDTVLSPA